MNRLKQDNDQLCILLQCLVERAGGEIRISPMELNRAVTEVKDTQSKIDKTTQEIVITFAGKHSDGKKLTELTSPLILPNSC